MYKVVNSDACPRPTTSRRADRRAPWPELGGGGDREDEELARVLAMSMEDQAAVSPRMMPDDDEDDGEVRYGAAVL